MSRSRFQPMGAAQIAQTNALMATNEAQPVKAERRPIIDAAAVRRAEREALAARGHRGIRIVQNKLLGGWFIVSGPYQVPIGGRFATRAEAAAKLYGARA